MSRFWCRWGPAPPKTPLGKKTNPPARMSRFFQTKTTLPHGCQGFPAQSNGTPTQANASKRKQTEVKAGKSQQTQAKASQILFGICLKCLKKKNALPVPTLRQVFSLAFFALKNGPVF